MQASLESEQRAKAEGLRIKKKLEGEINELEIGLDHANKANSEGLKAIKRYQNQLRETIQVVLLLFKLKIRQIVTMVNFGNIKNLLPSSRPMRTRPAPGPRWPRLSASPRGRRPPCPARWRSPRRCWTEPTGPTVSLVESWQTRAPLWAR